MTLEWVPLSNSSLSGEVKKTVILIYEKDLRKAVNTLRHEFFDFLVCMAIKPYENVTILYKVMINELLGKLGEKAYLEKERIVEALTRIL